MSAKIGSQWGFFFKFFSTGIIGILDLKVIPMFSLTAPILPVTRLMHFHFFFIPFLKIPLDEKDVDDFLRKLNKNVVILAFNPSEENVFTHIEGNAF